MFTLGIYLRSVHSHIPVQCVQVLIVISTTNYECAVILLAHINSGSSTKTTVNTFTSSLSLLPSYESSAWWCPKTLNNERHKQFPRTMFHNERAKPPSKKPFPPTCSLSVPVWDAQTWGHEVQCHLATMRHKHECHGFCIKGSRIERCRKAESPWRPQWDVSPELLAKRCFNYCQLSQPHTILRAPLFKLT